MIVQTQQLVRTQMVVTSVGAQVETAEVCSVLIVPDMPSCLFV